MRLRNGVLINPTQPLLAYPIPNCEMFHRTIAEKCAILLCAIKTTFLSCERIDADHKRRTNKHKRFDSQSLINRIYFPLLLRIYNWWYSRLIGWPKRSFHSVGALSEKCRALLAFSISFNRLNSINRDLCSSQCHGALLNRIRIMWLKSEWGKPSRHCQQFNFIRPINIAPIWLRYH